MQCREKDFRASTKSSTYLNRIPIVPVYLAKTDTVPIIELDFLKSESWGNAVFNGDKRWQKDTHTYFLVGILSYLRVFHYVPIALIIRFDILSSVLTCYLVSECSEVIFEGIITTDAISLIITNTNLVMKCSQCKEYNRQISGTKKTIDFKLTAAAI